MCPVCIEPLQKDPTKFIRYVCCGKGIHKWCDEGMKVSSLSQKQKDSCPLCRTKYPDSDEEELEQLLKWVEKGKAWAQNILGEKYLHGNGVEKSAQQAIVLFELSASQGYAKAQFNIGFMYDTGKGVKQSYERAAAYYEAAARQGIAYAQVNLGCLYFSDQGVYKSFEKAREWWGKAAEQGNEGAIQGLQQLDEIEGRTPSFIPKPLECAFCYRPHGDPKHKLRPCSRCHRVFYCGKECQVKHWKKKINGHKKICESEEARKARKAREKREAKKDGGGEEPKTTTATRVTFRF